jgi:hypothetical protein
VYEQEESWIKIHSAEALVAGGEAIAIRDRFLGMRPTVDSLPYRVGVWRVLANTSPTLAQRAACVAEVERIYLNPAASDRSQALETLCKLRIKLAGPTLERVREARQQGGTGAQVGLTLWALQLAGEAGALEGLTDLLRSSDVTARLVAAYALRLLDVQDATTLRALGQAADAESPDTRAYPFLLSAAVSLRADSSRLPVWRAALQKVLTQGSDDARFEAAQGLLPRAGTSELPTYVSLLDAAGSDTRVGAALTILQVQLRK